MQSSRACLDKSLPLSPGFAQRIWGAPLMLRTNLMLSALTAWRLFWWEKNASGNPSQAFFIMRFWDSILEISQVYKMQQSKRSNVSILKMPHATSFRDCVLYMKISEKAKQFFPETLQLCNSGYASLGSDPGGPPNLTSPLSGKKKHEPPAKCGEIADMVKVFTRLTWCALYLLTWKKLAILITIHKGVCDTSEVSSWKLYMKAAISIRAESERHRLGAKRKSEWIHTSLLPEITVTWVPQNIIKVSKCPVLICTDSSKSKRVGFPK